MQTQARRSGFGQHPVTSFATPLQFIFTWVLPYALMGFSPAAFRRRRAALRVDVIVLGLWGWQTALRRDQSGRSE
jgi:ABC-type uncharacterized transport system permease subunit